MRCPHCAGEVPRASRYCGICGRSLTLPPAGSRSGAHDPDAGSMSLFEMPASRRARAARLFVVLALDAMLAGAGIAMIISYTRARADADQPADEQLDAGVTAEVKVLPPTPVRDEPRATDSGAGAGGSVDRQARSPVARDRAPVRGEGTSRDPARATEPAAAGTEPAKTPAPTEPPPTSDPQVSPPAAVADAGVEPDEEEVSRMAARIELVVKGHEAQVQRCYARAAKSTTPTDPLEGRIDIRFSVMPNGSSSNVRVARNTSGSTQLGSCVAGLVSSWEFPSGASQSMDFIWPFQFSAPKK